MEKEENLTVTIAKQIVTEETDKLMAEIVPDVRELMDKWSERLLKRIDERMDALGVEQLLEVEVTWDPVNYPEFKFSGATNVGAKSDQD